MSVALIPDSAAPTIAPVAAPAKVTTLRTTFPALLRIPGAEAGFPDFFRPLFLLAVEDTDFFAGDCFVEVLFPVDRFFVFFVVAINLLPVPSTNVNGFRPVGPPSQCNRKERADR